ncbi:MAG: hypothetical protein N2645_09230 [Clostridia bacterium]|nr:hypothetical protein [Clostridia bacterium]
MFKKNIRSVKALCALIVSAILISCFGLTAFAAVLEKTVSVTDYKTVTVPDSQMAATMGNPPVPQTLYYNDGQYKGTLYLKTATMNGMPNKIPGTNIWECKFSIVYEGIVTKTVLEKTVSVTDYKTVTVPDSQMAATMGNPPVPQTLYYDNGQYKGTLYLKTATMNGMPNKIPGTNLWECKFSIVYEGTVQGYR